MGNIADLLTDGNNGMYPRDFESRDDAGQLVRWQRIIAPGRFVMLLKHPISGHYCGYVGIKAEGDSLYNFEVAGRTVTYEGFGTRDISWRWYNASQKLVSPGKISDAESDYWVGFDLQHAPGTPESEAIRLVLDFETAVRDALVPSESRP